MNGAAAYCLRCLAMLLASRRRRCRLLADRAVACQAEQATTRPAATACRVYQPLPPTSQPAGRRRPTSMFPAADSFPLRHRLRFRSHAARGETDEEDDG